MATCCKTLFLWFGVIFKLISSHIIYSFKLHFPAFWLWFYFQWIPLLNNVFPFFLHGCYSGYITLESNFALASQNNLISAIQCSSIDVYPSPPQNLLWQLPSKWVWESYPFIPPPQKKENKGELGVFFCILFGRQLWGSLSLSSFPQFPQQQSFWLSFSLWSLVQVSKKGLWGLATPRPATAVGCPWTHYT